VSEKVCAVIVTYNRKDLLRECLNAVLSQTRPPDHVLVVDNASTDGTPER
jgi:rhamnopyranosyl-N-acetylglucosaminyl-diphospho-decaprenol beta-1,3/1,4-galactofuranosyltransferase